MKSLTKSSRRRCARKTPRGFTVQEKHRRGSPARRRRESGGQAEGASSEKGTGRGEAASGPSAAGHLGGPQWFHLSRRIPLGILADLPGTEPAHVRGQQKLGRSSEVGKMRCRRLQGLLLDTRTREGRSRPLCSHVPSESRRGHVASSRPNNLERGTVEVSIFRSSETFGKRPIRMMTQTTLCQSRASRTP